MNEIQSWLKSMVRTENEAEKTVLKSKTTPVGSYAVPDESTSFLDVNTPWLPLVDVLRNFENYSESANRVFALVDKNI